MSAAGSTAAAAVYSVSPSVTITTMEFDRLSTDSGVDNPFRPDGDLSREAQEIVDCIKRGLPVTPTRQHAGAGLGVGGTPNGGPVEESVVSVQQSSEVNAASPNTPATNNTTSPMSTSPKKKKKKDSKKKEKDESKKKDKDESSPKKKKKDKDKSGSDKKSSSSPSQQANAVDNSAAAAAATTPTVPSPQPVNNVSATDGTPTAQLAADTPNVKSSPSSSPHSAPVPASGKPGVTVAEVRTDVSLSPTDGDTTDGQIGTVERVVLPAAEDDKGDAGPKRKCGQCCTVM